METKFKLRQKVWFTVADTSPLGGGRHRGIIDNIVADMFDKSVLYIVKAQGGAVVPVREEAIEEYRTRKYEKVQGKIS